MQRKNKIVFAMEQPRFENRPNGVSLVCQIQEECLNRLGYDTHLVAPRYPNAIARRNDILLPSRLISKGDNFYITDPLQYLSVHAQLFGCCLDLNPDLFYLNGPYWTAVHMASIARKLGIPYILHVHTDIKGYALARSPRMGGIAAKFMFMMAMHVAKHATELIVPSVHYRDAFVKETGYSRLTKVLPTVIPGFSLMSVGDREKFASKFRAKLGIPRNEGANPIIVVNGRVQREKGLDRAIYNLKSLLAQCADNPVCRYQPHLVFVGGYDPKYRRELEKMAEAFGVRHRIYFAGEKTNQELLKINQIAWLLWFVSTTDTQGLVLVEAAHCGLPVMGYRGFVFSEFFPDEFLGADLSPVDWGFRTRVLLDSPEHYHEKALYCQKKAKAYTDIERYEKSFEDIIEQAIAG